MTEKIFHRPSNLTEKMSRTQESGFSGQKKHWIVLTINMAAFAILMFCVLLMALNASKGFDLTDRSYYLLWAEQPEKVTGSITHFGYVTNLIYEMVGRDIKAFRIAGLMILLVIAFFFALPLRKYLREIMPEQADSFSLGLLITVVLTGTLFYYQSWLHEPSYNWLALTGTILTLTGLCLLRAKKTFLLFTFAVLLTSLGGVLAFLAKPTTALALVLIVFLWVWAYCPGKKGLALMCLAVISTALMGSYVCFFFGSAQKYFDNLKFGYELGAVLGGGHSLVRTVKHSTVELLSFLKWWVTTPYVWLLFLAMVFSYACSFFKRTAWLSSYLRHVLPVLILLCFIHLIYRYYLEEALLYISSILLTVLGLVVLSIGNALISKNAGFACRFNKIQVRTFFLPVLFFVMATMAPSFGTISNFVRRMSESTVFLAVAILIGLAFLTPEKIRRMTCSVFGLLLGVLLLLAVFSAYERPYRLPGSIMEQNTAVEFFGSDWLILDETTAQYVEELRNSAYTGGWQKGTILIDMTGGSPGALVILEAQIPGTPWLLGNYPGSDEFVDKVLGSVDPEKLKKAWVLTAPEGRRRINEKVLENNNLIFPDDYEMLGSFRTGHRYEEQFLWKPRYIFDETSGNLDGYD